MKFYSVTIQLIIQLEATEQYYPAVLFVMLNKVVLTLLSVDQQIRPSSVIKPSNMTVQMKSTARADPQYFPVVLFVRLCKRKPVQNEMM